MLSYKASYIGKTDRVNITIFNENLANLKHSLPENKIFTAWKQAIFGMKMKLNYQNKLSNQAFQISVSRTLLTYQKKFNQ